MKKIFFDAGDEKLAGLLVSDDESEKPSFLFLHGAGTSHKERVLPLADLLLARGVSSLVFDFSGHGESTGEMSQSSLKKRVGEAREAAKFLNPGRPLTLCGASMGAHIALKLLEHLDIANIILFVPGVYNTQAYEVNFNETFTSLIRQPESWRDSDVYELLEGFTGNLLVFCGEKDDLIPQGVIELLRQHSKNARSSEIIYIPEAPHRILLWLSDYPEVANRVADKIASVIE